MPQCGIRAHVGTGYCASSVHEKNTSPQPTQDELCAASPGEAESSEVGGAKGKTCKDSARDNEKRVVEIFTGLGFLKLLIMILNTARSDQLSQSLQIPAVQQNCVKAHRALRRSQSFQRHQTCQVEF